MSRSFVPFLTLCFALSVGCGARTGLNTSDGGPRPDVPDASVPDVPTIDVPVADIPIDVPIDVPPDVPDVVFPMCGPDAVRVSGREASVPVDTIWALDSSFSMVDNLENLTRNIDVFWNALSMADVDSQTIFVAQDGYAPPPPGGFAGRFISVNQRVGSRDPLVQLLSAFEYYGPRLRPDATTHFVVVTDDNSLDLDWEPFREQMRILLGHDFTFHAVASEQLPPTIDNPQGVCFDDTGGSAWRAGTEYYEMAAATGGVALSICEEDWSLLFERLNERIAIRIPLPCAYSLPRVPPMGIAYDPDNFVVYANVAGEPTPRVLPRVADDSACTASGGWWFFEGSDRVHLCDTSCDELEALDARIEVDLGCED